MACSSIAGLAADDGHGERLNGAPRTLAANEFLFRSGELRTHIFRVESGAICLYETRSGDRPSLIEFVFPGEYVGLGFLEKHHMSARALIETRVACLPLSATSEVVSADARTQARLAQSIEREFEIRRDELRDAGQRRPIERVAALLVTSARTNVEQGRPAAIITDSWRCGVIADLLQLTLDDLTAILLELERRDLVEAAPAGLRLKDIAALEALADGVSPTVEPDAPRAQRSARPPALLPHYKAA